MFRDVENEFTMLEEKNVEKLGIKVVAEDWGCNSVVDCMSNMHEAQSSILNTRLKKKQK